MSEWLTIGQTAVRVDAIDAYASERKPDANKTSVTTLYVNGNVLVFEGDHLEAVKSAVRKQRKG